MQNLCTIRVLKQNHDLNFTSLNTCLSLPKTGIQCKMMFKLLCIHFSGDTSAWQYGAWKLSSVWSVYGIRVKTSNLWTHRFSCSWRLHSLSSLLSARICVCVFCSISGRSANCLSLSSTGSSPRVNAHCLTHRTVERNPAALIPANCQPAAQFIGCCQSWKFKEEIVCCNLFFLLFYMHF